MASDLPGDNNGGVASQKKKVIPGRLRIARRLQMPLNFENDKSFVLGGKYRR
jgi:hypothetical protein